MAKIALVFTDTDDGAIEFELISPKGQELDLKNPTPAQEVAIETYEAFRAKVTPSQAHTADGKLH